MRVTYRQCRLIVGSDTGSFIRSVRLKIDMYTVKEGISVLRSTAAKGLVGFKNDGIW